MQLRLLALSNALFLLSGGIAYATAWNFSALVALSILPAIAGLWQLRHTTEGQSKQWVDRAFSAAVGTWATLAMMVLIALISVQDGVALLETRGFAVLAIIVAGLGTLAWNAAAFQGLADFDDMSVAKRFGLFHLLLAVVAIIVAMRDGMLHDVVLSGEELQILDLQLAPALAAAPGLMWAMAFWRLRATE